MKAVICKTLGGPETLVVEDIPALKAGPGQIVIDVKAAGVNFPDLLIMQGKYQFKAPLPFSPGAEASGIVKSLGEGVTGFKPGDAVIAHMIWGAFAQEAVIEAKNATRMPAGMDFNVAAGFTVTYATSYHGLKDRAKLKKGETLLVLGAAGGVGLAAVELGKLMGARVIAAASSAEKLATCKRFGADVLINYETQDLREAIRAATDGKGVDVVYDPVGGKYSEPALRSLKWKGRHLVVGFAAGDIPKISLNLALLKGCSIVGVFWGGFSRNEPKKDVANIAQLAAWIVEGKLKPMVSTTYPLARAGDALADLAARRVQGKAVLVV